MKEKKRLTTTELILAEIALLQMHIGYLQSGVVKDRDDKEHDAQTMLTYARRILLLVRKLDKGK